MQQVSFHAEDNRAERDEPVLAVVVMLPTDLCSLRSFLQP